MRICLSVKTDLISGLIFLSKLLMSLLVEHGNLGMRIKETGCLIWFYEFVNNGHKGYVCY